MSPDGTVIPSPCLRIWSPCMACCEVPFKSEYNMIPNEIMITSNHIRIITQNSSWSQVVMRCHEWAWGWDTLGLTMFYSYRPTKVTDAKHHFISHTKNGGRSLASQPPHVLLRKVWRTVSPPHLCRSFGRCVCGGMVFLGGVKEVTWEWNP